MYDLWSLHIHLSAEKQRNCLAIKNAAVASVAVWSAYWTTLLGISLCLWIWLRGIDRFLSRQMWIFVAPYSAPSAACVVEGRTGDWIALIRPPRIDSAGNDYSSALYVKIKYLSAYFGADLSYLPWQMSGIFPVSQLISLILWLGSHLETNKDWCVSERI